MSKLSRIKELLNLKTSIDTSIRKLRTELREEQHNDRESLVAEWEYFSEASIQGKSNWSSDLPEGTEMVYVTRKLTNKHIFDEHMKKYGSINNMPEDSGGINYYRVGTVLLTSGGGTIVIKTKLEITDGEWKALQHGVVPNRLKR